MKKFQFTLEKVLEVKEIEEKIIQRELIKIQNQISDMEKNVEKLTEKISTEKNKVTTLTSKIIKSLEIMVHYRYIDSLNADKDKFIELIRKLRIEEDKLHNELIEKSREKKALERLKEIKYEEFKKEYKKQQQNIMNEISIQNHKLRVGSIL